MSKRLGCGTFLSLNTHGNPYLAYKTLLVVREHFKTCLPCLVEGSFLRQMEKSIQKLIMCTLVRLAGILCAWVTLAASFLWTHKDVREIRSMDFCFLVAFLALLGFSAAVTLSDGPREYND